MNEPESKHLLEGWLAGDQNAARIIFSRYFARMSQLARTQMSPKVQVRSDSEDVAQSALRTFFEHAVHQNFALQRSGDLWRLLAAITVNKAKQHVQFHRAAKRSIDKELARDEASVPASSIDPASDEPSPENALALAEELSSFLQTLEPLERQVLELRLQNLSSSEIATKVSRSTRTVRRSLVTIKELLSLRLGQVQSHV